MTRWRAWDRWHQADRVISGLALGLYVSRVLTERRAGAWPLLPVALIALLAGLAGVALLAWGGRRWRQCAPLALLLLYVLSPWPRSDLAWAVLFVALVCCFVLSTRDRPLRFAWLPEFSLFLIALALYVATLAPGILPADSGEFQFVTYVLGIAHPPGYPLYTLLGKLFTCLPFGDVAYRVNLFSAVIAALTLVGVRRAALLATRSQWLSWVAAVALGVTPTFWAQATTANIRAMTAFFTAWQLYFLLRYGEQRSQQALVGFALVFGFGIGHHGSLVFLAIPYAFYLLAVDPTLWQRWRFWARPAFAFVGSFLVLLYLPLRSLMGAPFDAQPIRSVGAFLDHVLARGFGGDMFAFIAPGVLRDRLPVLGNILVFQFGHLLLAVALLGFIALLWRECRLWLLIGGTFLVSAFVAITYRAPQTVEYLLPAYVAMALLISAGAALFWRWRQPVISGVAVALILWWGADNLRQHYPSFAALHHDASARDRAVNLLQAAPPEALILANWHDVTPLWYLQYVEGLRPDLRVDYVYPEGSTPNAEVWQRRINEALSARPVIVTSYYREFEALPYRFLPFHGAQQVVSGPLRALPGGMRPVDAVFEDKIRILGYDVSADELTMGDELVVRIAWQPTQPLQRDYSFFVHLVNPTDGVPLGQGDKTHAAARYQVGELLIDEYQMPLLPTAAAGHYTLLTGVYITFPEGGWQRLPSSAGGDAVTLGDIAVRPPTQPPVTTHPLQLTFANGLRCVGADYDTSVRDTTRLYLHWRVPDGTTACEIVISHRGGIIGRVAAPTTPGYATIAADLPPGQDWQLGLRVAGTGEVVSALGPWHLPLHAAVPLPRPLAGERHIIFGGEMSLEQVSWSPAEVWQTGATGRVTLVWQSLRALTRDYSVSVNALAPDGRTVAQYDTTPALGAIPTFKWVRGKTIADLHPVSVPAEESAGEASLRVTVYDAFSLQPLAVSDDRLARMGQGTQVEVGRVQLRP